MTLAGSTHPFLVIQQWQHRCRLFVSTDRNIPSHTCRIPPDKLLNPKSSDTKHFLKHPANSPM